MNSDFKELLDALNAADVEYLIVGGYAVINHSRPRNLMRAFRAFGMPLIDIEEGDFAVEGTQYVIGRPPSAIDFLTSLGGLDFDSCYRNRIIDTVEGSVFPYMGKEDLIAAKKIANRPEDIVDIRNLTILDD